MALFLLALTLRGLWELLLLALGAFNGDEEGEGEGEEGEGEGEGEVIGLGDGEDDGEEELMGLGDVARLGEVENFGGVAVVLELDWVDGFVDDFFSTTAAQIRTKFNASFLFVTKPLLTRSSARLL